MSQRRKLSYLTFDELVADLQQLKTGFHTVGQWSLGQMCDHLKMYFDGSMHGFGFKMPWYLRLGAPLILKYTLKKRWMPAGVKTPSHTQPRTLADTEAADALLATIVQYRKWQDPLHPSPLFGMIDRDTWDQLHLIHAAHHFSFAVPEPAPVAGGV